MLQFSRDSIAQTLESAWTWVILIVFFGFVQWMKPTPKSQTDEKQPPMLGHVFPFVGHAFKLAGDKKKFFLDAL